jgi:pimeloyl-ACP methyl ester carboxylesterase
MSFRPIRSAAVAAALAVAPPAAASSHSGRALDFPATASDPCSRISVQVFGDRRAETVLVLVPAYGAGAGLLTVVARELAGAVPKLQVWLPERREQNLIAQASGDAKGCTAATANIGSWGLATTLGDLRRVVRSASAHGHRKALLGGHSWGATEALMYAAWDFDGRAGYRDLSGLLLIDGGTHDSFAGEGLRYRVTREQAEHRLAEIDRTPIDNRLSQLVGSAEPAVGGRFYRAAARAALTSPHSKSFLSEHLSPALRPQGAVTNLALIGWLFDAGAPVDDVKLHLGHFPASGEVRDWVSDDRRKIKAFVTAAASDHPVAWEYYWPKRLSLDLEAADGFAETATTKLLQLKLTHAREIDIPLYSFETGLTKGSVNQSAHWVVDHSRIAEADFAEDQDMSHLDPLFATPDRNRFVATAAAFLRKIRSGARDCSRRGHC